MPLIGTDRTALKLKLSPKHHICEQWLHQPHHLHHSDESPNWQINWQVETFIKTNPHLKHTMNEGKLIMEYAKDHITYYFVGGAKEYTVWCLKWSEHLEPKKQLSLI
jgi:hypothetical protein